MKKVLEKWSRTLALILTIGMLTSLFGCGSGKKEASVANIVTDEGIKELPVLTLWVDSTPLLGTEEMQSLLLPIPGQDEEFHVQYEIVDYHMDGDRSIEEARISRIRTEIIAGKGPDLFLCDSISRCPDLDGKGKIVTYAKTFSFPQQAMDNRVFLPLDKYIENAQYMDWDQLNQKIMAAGRNELGQVILPLTYSFSVSLCLEEKLTKTYDLPMTYSDQIHSGDPFLISAAMPYPYWLPNTREELNALDDLNIMYSGVESLVLDPFGQPADFESEELSFTLEEFRETVLEAWELHQNREESYPRFEDGHFSRSMSIYDSVDQGLLQDYEKEYLILPRYNRDGGITATVGGYAAVNANTAYPEYAFQVLDYLLSEPAQTGSAAIGNMGGIPVLEGVGRDENHRGWGRGASRWFMTPHHYSQFQVLRDQINAVKFETPLDIEANVNLWQRFRDGGCTQEALESSIKTAYTTMKMMLAES